MAMRKPSRAVAAALLATSIAIALYRTLTAPSAAAPTLKGGARERVAAAIALQEVELRRRATLEFPGDRWSQSDAFGALEQDKVREAARNEKVAIGSVLEVMDGDLRAHRSPGRAVGAAPCKPRPFYD
jgi:hypothetical protein